MQTAVLLFFGVPTVLAVTGVVVLVQGLRNRSQPQVPRSASTQRILAGSVLIVSALLSVAVLVADLQYGIVIFPVLALILAVGVAVPLLATASAAARRAAPFPPPGGTGTAPAGPYVPQWEQTPPPPDPDEPPRGP